MYCFDPPPEHCYAWTLCAHEWMQRDDAIEHSCRNKSSHIICKGLIITLLVIPLLLKEADAAGDDAAAALWPGPYPTNVESFHTKDSMESQAQPWKQCVLGPAVSATGLPACSKKPSSEARATA
eukprot:1340016-Amphidinium_carterae.1